MEKLGLNRSMEELGRAVCTTKYIEKTDRECNIKIQKVNSVLSAKKKKKSI